MSSAEIIAIVIACLAAVIAAVFIFLYVRKTRQEPAEGTSLKPMAFENASYSRSQDTVHLENPGMSNS